MRRAAAAAQGRDSQAPARLVRAPGRWQWLDGAFDVGGLMMVSVLLRLRPSGLLEEFLGVNAYIAPGEARPACQRAFAAQLAVFKNHAG